ncbi:MAG: IclR family transcriptional regulator [Spirochaetes bacterium]|uniref:IclR family transcriptional regulator n=1 Tax=Candidatus Ornithospirochaeta stercoripullorum TaxID=2840899 RepID=A0A9D9H4W9_9SPIO|nr:IclR family transcriptional regulator [Candidatus Ornithospirochaeta stercoripullorum]
MHSPTMRVISIINLIASHNSELTLSGISKALSIPSSTIYPILKTLVETSFLDMNQENKTYSIGLRCFLSGMPFIGSNNSFSSISAILNELTEATGETTHFSKLDGGEVLYLLKVESPQPIRMYSALGKTLPAYGTALGKALLSDFSLEQLHSIYPDGLRALTENTITDFDVLKTQLDDVRATGFAYECEESNIGVRCIARPIHKNGKVAAAISVGIPVFRYTEEKRKEIESLLLEASERVEEIVPYLDYV